MKNYRIIRVAGVYYPETLKSFERKYPDAGRLSHEEQLDLFFQMKETHSNGFSKYMRRLGNDAREIVFNVESFQRKWAEERGLSFHPQTWRYDILIDQITMLKPDVLYFQDIVSLPYSLRKTIKEHCPSIKLVFVHKGYPGAFNELSDVDMLFAAYPALCEAYRKAGVPSCLLYHAFNEDILEELTRRNQESPVVPMFPFTFVGSSGFGWGMGHQRRYWDIVRLMRTTNLEAWNHDHMTIGPVGWFAIRTALQSIAVLLRPLGTECVRRLMVEGLIPEGKTGERIKTLLHQVREEMQEHGAQQSHFAQIPVVPLETMFPRRCHKSVFGMEMYDLLSRSTMTFNRHTDATGDNVANMRLFEATGVGTCLLTDDGVNMPDLFVRDEEVATYSSVEECVEKARFLLSHEDARKRIAAAGQRRTLRDHTIRVQCEKIHDIIQRML